MRLLQVGIVLGLWSCGGPSEKVEKSTLAPEQTADAIWQGGPIYTMVDGSPMAEAVAVKDGRILGVGDLEAMTTAHAGEGTVTVDLEGKTMLPGFVDAHGHVVNVGLQVSSANLLPPPDGEGSDIAAVTRLMNEWSASEPLLKTKTGWIVGFGYDDSQLAEKRHPTRADLDKISTDVPVMIIHQSGHIGVLNSKGLELAKISAASESPEGGLIRKGPDGEPTGVLEENAWFMSLFAFLATVDDELNEQLFEEGMKMYARFGYTTAQEGRALESTVGTMMRVAQKGPLLLDVVVYPDYLAPAVMKPEYMEGYKNNLRIGGMKITIDGSPQGKTAWLTKPYFVPPEGQGKDYVGYAAISQEVANEQISKAYENGWQVLAHANGDAAIDRYIEAIEVATKAHGAGDRRPVLIHGQTLRPDQIPELKRLGIFPSLFPMHTFYWGDWHRESVLGPERAEFISPTKAVLDAGMWFTTHHDAPIANPDSIRVLSATVTRETRSGYILGPDQRVSPEVALKAMTIWSAYQHFEEDEKGSLETGKVADFVVLSDDPMKVKPEDLDELKVLTTIRRGRQIYPEE